MTSEDSKKNRILDLAFKKFTTIGIQQVTMDDVARGVGMGKGTLYKYFPSKEILLMNVIEFFAGRIEKSLEEIMNDETLPMSEKLNRFLQTVADKISKINPATLTYMERNMPEVYEKLEKTREQMILKNLIRIFDEGKRNGFFQPDMDNYLVAHIFIGAIRHVIEAKILTTMDYTLDQIFRTIISTIFEGCLTEEGRRLSYSSE